MCRVGRLRMGLRGFVSELLVLTVITALGVVVAVVISDAVRGGSAGPRERSLAERINGACGRAALVDWTSGDEWDRLPAGTVQVTCSRRDGTLFYVAVGR